MATRRTSKKNTAVVEEAEVVEAAPASIAEEPKTEPKEEAPKKRTTRAKTLSALDPNELVELSSCVEGKLVYVSNSGYTIEWSEFGDIHLVPISEIIKMRNEQPAFFRNHWVYPVSENADEVIAALQLERYYNKLADLKDFDELFDYEPDQLAGILKDATVYMKENVARRAAQLVSSGELDSVSVIDAVEKATGFKIKDQA